MQTCAHILKTTIEHYNVFITKPHKVDHTCPRTFHILVHPQIQHQAHLSNQILPYKQLQSPLALST